MPKLMLIANIIIAIYKVTFLVHSKPIFKFLVWFPWYFGLSSLFLSFFNCLYRSSLLLTTLGFYKTPEEEESPFGLILISKKGLPELVNKNTRKPG